MTKFQSFIIENMALGRRGVGGRAGGEGGRVITPLGGGSN